MIATSGPSSTYPKRAYRNPTEALVRFLDSKHGDNWAIWEFRAEGTGYPDSEVYGRIHHFPWPDHHPPPFALIPAIMASMRNWLSETTGDKPQKRKRVAVVHCKAGKGRSGTVACSYLISQEGWKKEDALRRFTERRMRVGFGNGVSIPSQVRWVGYVDRWANKMKKIYVERPVEILEIHVWGLRDGVKIAIEGYVDEGKKIKCFHLFRRKERIIVDDGKTVSSTSTDSNSGNGTPQKKVPTDSSAPSSTIYQPTPAMETVTSPVQSGNLEKSDRQISAAILRPRQPVILPSSDVNIDFERRTKAAYTNWAMVTSVAHVWFNAYFEGGDKHDSGVFECDWVGLDGIKGSARKGTQSLERVKVLWRYPSVGQLGGNDSQAGQEEVPGKVISLPKPGEPVPESHAADWRGDNVTCEDDEGKDAEESPKDTESTDPTISGRDSSSKRSSSKSPLRRKFSRSKDSAKESKGLTGDRHPLVAEATTALAVAANSTADHFSHLGKELGLRRQTAASRDISLASSVEDLRQQERRKEEEQKNKGTEKGQTNDDEDDDSDLEGVRPYFRDDNGNGTSEAPSDGGGKT